MFSPHIDPQLELDTRIDDLGDRTVPSPLTYKRFVGDRDRVLYDLDPDRVIDRIAGGGEVVAFERAGPRDRVFFDPANVKVAIVTCGGLCPGLNDVIRSMVHELTFMYGVKRIKGVRNGYAGLNPAHGLSLVDLTPASVRHIHEDGGTFLGSSRGPQPVEAMVDTLVREDVRVLFTIGGDGTLRGARSICAEIYKRDLRIAVVGVPKTIDNDINLVSRSFGFDTAVSAAQQSLRCAHTEARGAINGIGIVKLMGRHSGFVAASAALAQADANFVLVPEVPFDLDGARGLLAALDRRLEERGHAVIVVAEGAGQHLVEIKDRGEDASGNKKLGDIGALLKRRISEHRQAKGDPFTVKYIDPSYIIRSVPACANDNVFCVFLGQNAVHAGMAGKTGVLISSWNNQFVHIPIEAAVKGRKQLRPDGPLWLSVLEATGQPEQMVNG
jgi:6-phosphofructokinase 1